MDKDLLRIVIVLLGIIVMVGLWVWSAYKNRTPKRKVDFYDDNDPLDDSLVLTTENDDFDIVPLGSAKDDGVFTMSEEDEAPIQFSKVDSSELDAGFDVEEQREPKAESNSYDGAIDLSTKTQQAKAVEIVVPDIIQFYILALEYEGFNGNNLRKVFKNTQMTYGSTKIYECLDSQRRVKFSVASLEEPGTFPESKLESFSCPGIVFFLQVKEVANPIQVFDELIETIDEIATELDGVKLDHGKQPLSKSTILHIRNALKLI